MRKRAKRLAGRGSVLLIAGLLLGSASIRVVTSAGEVLAAEGGPFVLPLPGKDAAVVAAEPERVETTSLLQALREREERVAERERQVALRIKAMNVAQEELQRRLTALEQAEERLKSTIALADTAAESDIARLTAVYENMKPKDAAALFEEMDPEFAAGFLARMRPDAAAGVMTGLSPQVAYSVSEILAGRNANAPTE